MSGLTAALRQVDYTNRAFWRNPAAAFFTIAFPLMFLVLFSVLFGGGSVPVAGTVVPVSAFYVPAIAAFSVITACYTNFAMTVVFARDNGVLKRFAGTPMPAWSYMVGRVVHAVLIAVLLVVVCVAYGALVYGVDVPFATLPAFVLTLVVGAAAFSALGLAVVVVIPNADAAPAVVNASILPLLFVSNVFIPLQDPPAWLDVLSSVFPVRPFADALLASFFAAPEAALRVGDLLVVAAWGLFGLLVAVRWFSYRPRT